MESVQNLSQSLSKFSRVILIGFVIALLLSVYFLFTLPAELRFKGNLQHLDFAIPVLVRLYVVLAITAALAILTIYNESTRAKVAIVYKEKTAAQIQEEKSQAESGSVDNLNAKEVSGNTNSELLGNALNLLAKKLDGVSGASYLTKEENGIKYAELTNGFALPLSENEIIKFNYGDGIVGQVAKSGTPIFIDEIPEGYIQAVSGLGKASPKFIMVIPIKKDKEVKGVLEIATFKSISNQARQVAEKFGNEIGEQLS